MPSTPNLLQSRTAQYGFAVLIAFAAIFLRQLLDPILGNSVPLATLYGAVAVAVWLSGWQPALLTAVIGYAGGHYLFMPPRHTFVLTGSAIWTGLAAYAGSCGLIIYLGEAMRRANERLRRQMVGSRAAEEAVQSSGARFAGIFDSAMDAIISVGEDQRIVMFNGAAEEIFRCPASEALGRPLDKFIPERFRKAHQRHVKAFGHTGVTNRSMSRPGTLLGLRSDGEEFPIEATISQVEAGGQKLFTVILRDVTEREEAEKRLVEQAGLLELASNAIIVRDKGGQISYWNHGAEELYGWTREEALGKVTHDLLKTEFPQPLADITEQFRRDNRWEGELVHTCKHGKHVRVLSRWALARDAAGVPGQVLEVNTDITARHQMEAALRASEERLEIAQQSARIGSWEWAVDAGKVIWSQGVPALHGLPADAFDGSVESWWKLIHEDDRETVRRAVEDALDGRRDYDVEFRTRWPDGSIHCIAARGKVFRDRNGRALRMVGIGIDVTERKQTEEALRNAEKMVATGQMASTLAHQINNPLAAAVNLAYILRSYPSLPEGLQGHAEMLDDELRRIGHIVRQTLSLYLEDVRSWPAVRLQEVIDGALGACRERLNGLSVETRCDAGCLVKVSRAELHQLVTNLILNAVEAFPDSQGSIKVHVFESRDWRNPDRSGVRIVVADSGVGIDPENRRRLFEPFFTTKRQKGSGLGLPVVQWIAAKYGGFLRVRSSTRPGRSGTCVSVFLCAETTQKKAAEPAETKRAVYRSQAT